jgi:glucosamine--fructose-6-phosphate aminotransferase (isomerizing)
MDKHQNHTLKEIQSQPAVWAESLKILEEKRNDLAAYLGREDWHSILFTGCGSTYYLSLAAAGAMQAVQDLPARGLPASEIWLNPGSVRPRGLKTLLVAVSRSGSTTETLRACQAFRAVGLGEILTLSCYPEAPLASLGDMNLVFPAGREESVAQTRSFSTLYLACVGLALLRSAGPQALGQLFALSQLASRLLEKYAAQALELGGDLRFDRTYFLGSGMRYGLASELSLKMKEMSLSHSEPFHFLEFRHGPMSMAGESTLLVGLLGGPAQEKEQQVLNDIAALGARTFMLGEQTGEVSFASGLAEPARTPLFLPLGQLLAYGRALSRGLNPDRPHNLSSVITLDAPG